MRMQRVEVETLMRKLQRGVGGKHALDDAHDYMAESYGTLGSLLQERDELRKVVTDLLLQVGGVTLTCDTFHHPARDKFHPPDQCGPLKRWGEIITRARALVVFGPEDGKETHEQA